MKKIALISTFCNTEEKQNLLKENIIKIKNLGIDVIAISPIQIPQDIVSLCDYFLYTKEKWIGVEVISHKAPCHLSTLPNRDSV